MRNKGFRALACFLAVLLLLPTFALAEGNTIHIRSAEDLLALADRCSLDSWSRGKTVVLSADISLSSVDFRPIPSFGGTFDGGGHTVSGLDLSGKLSPAGLFGILQEGAVVRGLTVSGTVAPGGDGDRVGAVAGENRGLISECAFSGTVTGKKRVGGIAGVNHPTGRIENCTVSGSITGSSMTGGMAGENQGTIAACRNQSYVNITSTDPGVNLSAMELTPQLFTLQSLDAVNIATDTGGVAGYSSGALLDCVNAGVVGYQHVGYNVGGVAGRSSGLVSGCANYGQVFGRKDIGGIVGQAEPYVKLNVSQDGVDTLRSQLRQLERLVDKAADDAQGTSDRVSACFSDVNDALDDVSARARTLSDRLGDYGGDTVAEINRGSDILADALDQLSHISKSAEGLSGKITDSLESLETVTRELKDAGVYTDQMAKELEAASRNLSDANYVLDASLAQIDTDSYYQAAQKGDWITVRAMLMTDLPAALGILKNGTNDSTGIKPGMTVSLKQALEHMENAMKELETASGQAQDALDALSEALATLRSASSQSETVLSGLQHLIDDLAKTDPLKFARPDKALGDAADDVFDSLNLLGVRLDALNEAAGGSAGPLADDLRAINHQFGEIMDTLLDTADDLSEIGEDDLISDTSEADIDAVVNGKLLSCVNEGMVSGDLCTGGIAGSMAVEYELDPEDDTLRSDTPAYRRSYELKAILQSCVNLGQVRSRRDYAGGICGKANIGLIAGCEGYGAVSSESGDYAGGIAGFSSGAVRDCWAKCTLSGGKYVGGIVGSASAENESSGGVVTGCRAFVRISEYEQFAGAVAGADRGSFQENLFVDCGLAGLGQVSLRGRAEPVSYEEMMQEKDLPARFRQLTLRFLTDGKEIKSVPFRYGASFDAGVFPEAPGKEGCFAQWDRTDLTDLRFDTEVSAVYTPYLTAISSKELRSDGRPVLLAEGRFSGNDDLALYAEESTALAAGFPANRRAAEIWTVHLPDDGAGVHTLRYLSPNGKTEALEIYACQGTSWKKLETETVGSYLLFQVEGSQAVFAAASRAPFLWRWVLLAAGIMALLLGLFLMLRLWRKRKKNAPQVKTAADPQRNKRRRKIGALIFLGALLAGLASAGIWFAFSGGLDGAAAVKLLYSYAQQETFAMDLSVQARVGDRRLSANTELVHLQVEGKGVTIARQLGTAAYYCDGAVYLENGASFHLGNIGAPDYGMLLGSVNLLYQGGSIHVFKSGSESIYTLTVEGEEARKLLRTLLPASEELAELEGLKVDLTARSGALYNLRFSADGTLTDGTPASISAVLTAKENWMAPEIPAVIRETILAGGSGTAEDSADLLRLLRAWGKLNLTDPLPVQVSLSADCGPLVVNTDLELFRTWLDGRQVGCVRKAGRSLYFSNGKIYGENGLSVDVGNEDPALQEQLLELSYALSLCSAAGCVQEGGTYYYTIQLEPQDWSRAAGAILPSVDSLGVCFTGGTLRIEVREDAIQSIQISCEGTLKLLFADTSVRLGSSLRFAPADFSLPEDVTKAILRDP